MEYNNMREMLEDRVAKTPDWFYLAYYGRYLTFKQFNDEVNRLANAFLKLGIKKRDIVYIHLTNCPEHLICTMAVLKIRAIACPLNPQFTPDELLYHVNDSRGVMTITESMNIGVVDAVRDQFKYIKNVIEIGDKVSERNLNYKNLIAQESTELKPIDIKSDDYAFIFYTSGTTGKPKGALLNHSNLVSTSIGMIKAIEESTGQVYDDNVNQRRAMYFLPLFHVNAMMSVLTCIYTGAKVALLKKFSVREFGPTVEQEKPETFSAVPKVYKILLEAKDTVKKYDLSSLERTVCGSAPMPVETINQFEKEFSIELYEAYGLTEATVASTMNLKGKRKIGSIGKPLPGQEVAIMDPEGKILPPGEVGEIVIRGSAVMQGYFERDEETRNTIRDGWLHTGDVGKMDEEGFVYISDRIKDMIIKGGENIYPKEIENIISKVPGVHDVAVIGIRDKLSGENVKAFIVPKIGYTLKSENIIEHCKKYLTSFKVPDEVEFVLGIPSSAVGKALKRKLRQGEGIFRLDETVDPIPINLVWEGMKARFNPSKAGKWKGKVAYEIHGQTPGVATFIVADGKIEVKEGKDPETTAVVRMTDIALRKLIEGKIDALTGMNSGMIQVDGSEADVAILGELMTA